jgi:hypothetical protein
MSMDAKAKGREESAVSYRETPARCASVAPKGARRRHPFGAMLRIAISALRAPSAA